MYSVPDETIIDVDAEPVVDQTTGEVIDNA
jgi:hypothetical protein